jgi:predicted nucleotidyltransferase component of viral defense system
MSVPEAPPIRLHLDPALFGEAVTYTAAETGFVPRLIEKDYFCTLLLQYLQVAGLGLVFKGGTCLAKVHAGFYRLSEDLDFSIPTPLDASRADRSRRVKRSRDAVARIGDQVPGFHIITPLTGANASTQYTGAIGYTSLLGAQEELIKIEVGLREPLLTAAIQGEVRTLLLDPISGSPLAPVLPLSCMSRDEAMAEKLRAALSRREVAVRDFYDVDHAVQHLGFQVRHPGLLELLGQKLAVPGNDLVDVSPARFAALRTQLDSQLKAVLRAQDFAAFDVERAFATVADVAAALAQAQ